jgi:hypothetical protein
MDARLNGKWGPSVQKACAAVHGRLQPKYRATTTAIRRSKTALAQAATKPMKAGRLICARRARREGGSGRSDTDKLNRSGGAAAL